MSRKNKADRFPTAEERWPRAGEMIPVNKKDRAFCIGNGKSRSGYDLEKLRPKGLIFGCNAIHREFMPDVLTAVDHGMIHEVYHSGLAQKIPCYFRDWTKVPAMMYETMLYGGLETLAVKLPCIITTDLRLNEPRYASLPNIMKARQKKIEKVEISSYGLDLKERLQTLEVNDPPERKPGVMVKNIEDLLEKLKNEAKVI